MDIKKLLKLVIDSQASDLHIIVGTLPHIRVNGVLSAVKDEEVVTKERARDLIFPMLNPKQKDLFLVNKELDFSVEFGTLGRFRTNVYFQKGSMSASLRLIGTKIRTTH